MKTEQHHPSHLTYAYLVVFCLFLIGILFVFFLLPNMPSMMEASIQNTMPSATIQSVAQFM